MAPTEREAVGKERRYVPLVSKRRMHFLNCTWNRLAGVGARAALRAGGEPTEDGLAEEAEGEDGGADEPMED